MKTATEILFILDSLALLSIIGVIIESFFFEKRFGSKYHHGSAFYNDKLKISIRISDSFLYVFILAVVYSFFYAIVFGIMNY